MTDRVGNWGRWGRDDERGALNLLTPEVVLKALASCRSGKVYSLGLPIQRADVPNRADHGPPQRLTLHNQADAGAGTAGQYRVPDGCGSNGDVLIIATHALTHIDALCHVFADDEFYNGVPASTVGTRSGAPHLGIDRMPWLVGRGVLLDLAAHAGLPWLAPGHVVTARELEGCADAQGVTVGAGDVLLLRTGWLEWFAEDADRAMADGQPGLGFDAVEFIRNRDVAAVAADNSAVEVMPFDRGVYIGVHIELLVKLGVPLVENVNLAEMARDRCYESLFIAAPLRITGGSGSPVNPIAIG